MIILKSRQVIEDVFKDKLNFCQNFLPDTLGAQVGGQGGNTVLIEGQRKDNDCIDPSNPSHNFDLFYEKISGPAPNFGYSGQKKFINSDKR